MPSGFAGFNLGMFNEAQVNFSFLSEASDKVACGFGYFRSLLVSCQKQQCFTDFGM